MVNALLKAAIRAHLEQGPATAHELADALGHHYPLIRESLSTLFYVDEAVTCNAAGRFEVAR